MSERRVSRQSEDARTGVSAVVKWYNETKGFGFVQPTDGSPDAFLHVSVVEAAGYRDIAEGATIECDLASGPKGAQVAAINHVDLSTSTPRQPRNDFGGRPERGGFSDRPERGGFGHQDFDEPAESLDGTVKFYNAAKGFGFITPDDGSRDVFISARTLERAGMMELAPEQRVRVSTRMGHKGPMAESVEVI